jgi:hypothetical protein
MIFKKILILLYLPFLASLGYSASLGEVRDFDIPIFLSQDLESISATVRAVRAHRSGFTLSFWVENSAWDTQDPNGLNGSNSQDRLTVLTGFASFVTQTLLPAMEGSSFNLNPVLNSASPGLNILFLDLKDQFKTTGSYVAAHFNPSDQDPGSGFNGMNLIYVDINPGTLDLEVDDALTKARTYTEILRVLSRMIQFQQDVSEDLWIREGISQYMIYRFLAQTPFPNTANRILDAPSKTLPEVETYLQDPRAMRAGFSFPSEDLDRVFVRTNPRAPLDNSLSQPFRGFSYLFFTYLFHQAGGGFSKKVTDGDRFFKTLMRTALDGFTGLEQALAEHSLPGFSELYRNFFLALFLDSNESRFQLPSFSRLSPTLLAYPTLESIGSVRTYRLDPYELGVERFRNLGDSFETEVHLSFPAGFGQAQALVLKQDSLGQWHQEGSFSDSTSFEFLPPGTEKLALIVNLDSSDHDYRTQIISSRFTQELPDDLVVSALASNPVTQVEGRQVFILDDSQLPSAGTSLNVILTLSSTGAKRLYIENHSSRSLAFSLEQSSIATQIRLELKGETRLSVSSLVPVTNERLILLREGAKGELWFFNENTQAVNLSLFIEAVDSGLFASQTSAFQSQVSPALSQEELQRIAGGGVGGCFVATAAYGRPAHPLVRILTRFRDRFLFSFSFGVNCVLLYYKYSPPLAKIIAGSLLLRSMTGILLLPLVLMAWIALNPWIGWILVLGLMLRVIRKGLRP